MTNLTTTSLIEILKSEKDALFFLRKVGVDTEQFSWWEDQPVCNKKTAASILDINQKTLEKSVTLSVRKRLRRCGICPVSITKTELPLLITKNEETKVVKTLAHSIQISMVRNKTENFLFYTPRLLIFAALTLEKAKSAIATKICTELDLFLNPESILELFAKTMKKLPDPTQLQPSDIKALITEGVGGTQTSKLPSHSSILKKPKSPNQEEIIYTDASVSNEWHETGLAAYSASQQLAVLMYLPGCPHSTKAEALAIMLAHRNLPTGTIFTDCTHLREEIKDYLEIIEEKTKTINVNGSWADTLPGGVKICRELLSDTRYGVSSIGRQENQIADYLANLARREKLTGIWEIEIAQNGKTQVRLKQRIGDAAMHTYLLAPQYLDPTPAPVPIPVKSVASDIAISPKPNATIASEHETLSLTIQLLDEEQKELEQEMKNARDENQEYLEAIAQNEKLIDNIKKQIEQLAASKESLLGARQIIDRIWKKDE